jgi:HK97 family phage major capsid protein/HK97 family phage prohead protease
MAVDLKPSESMAAEAKRGLAWRKEFGRGGTAVGVARARDISNRTNLSPSTVRRMVSYFARHEVDKKGEGFSPGEDGYPSAGRIAWALWGGDPGQSWANRKSAQLDREEEAKKMNRAYAVLEIKSYDEDYDDKPRKFKGIASTPTTDRMGDIVEPEGAQFKLPIPLLWQHDSRQPIGWITAAKVTKAGIEIEGEVARVSDEMADKSGTLKARLDEAWTMMKMKLVRGLSIGFQALEHARIDGTFGVRYMKWAWHELSAVTIPANAEANITAIKSADAAARRSALGAGRVVRLDKAGSASIPGDSGRHQPQVTKGNSTMKIAEQLAAFDTKRKSALVRMDEIMGKSATEGRTLDDAETEEYDMLGGEVKSIEQHVVRLKAHEQTMIEKATLITPSSGAAPGHVPVRSANSISVKSNIAPGTAFTRYAIALARAKGNIMQAEQIAKQWDQSTPEVGIVLKAAVAAGTTSDTTWAGPLVQYMDMVSEFIELLRPATILGRMTAVRRVPFNIRIPRQTSGITGSFVGEGAPTPVNKLAFDNILLPWSKASTIVVLTEELVRLSNPSAEALVRQDLIDGIAQFLDKRLVDPAFPGVANVSPASLTFGVTPREASGATLAAIDADVGFLMAQFANNELALTTGVWVMSAQLAITLSLLRTNQDAPAFPGLSMNGGTFYGLPVVVSNNVAPSGSPGDQHLILVDQREVLLADDGQMMIDMSTEASLQLNDAPSAGAQSLVSLWQNGLMGVKIDRWIYWTKRRSAAVQFIDAAQRYGS